MKTILSLCGAIALGLLMCLYWWFTKPEQYGEPFSGYQPVSVAALLDDPDTYVGKTVRIEGTVQRQCAATGCFFFFAVGDRSIRVELGDVVTFLPQRGGYVARVEGTLGKRGERYEFFGRSVEFLKK